MKPIKLILAAVLAICTLSACPSCKTDTGDPGKDRAGRVTNAALLQVGKFAEQAAFNIFTNAASQLVEGQKVDLGHAATAGLYVSMNNVQTAEAARAISDAWTGKKLPELGTVTAQAFAKADPQTPEDKAKVVKAIADGISHAALSASAP